MESCLEIITFTAVNWNTKKGEQGEKPGSSLPVWPNPVLLQKGKISLYYLRQPETKEQVRKYNHGI